MTDAFLFSGLAWLGTNKMTSKSKRDSLYGDPAKLKLPWPGALRGSYTKTQLHHVRISHKQNAQAEPLSLHDTYDPSDAYTIKQPQ